MPSTHNVLSNLSPFFFSLTVYIPGWSVIRREKPIKFVYFFCQKTTKIYKISYFLLCPHHNPPESHTRFHVWFFTMTKKLRKRLNKPSWYNFWPPLFTAPHFYVSFHLALFQENFPLPTLILHAFPACMASASLSPVHSPISTLLSLLTISVTTFLCPCLPESRRKKKF